MFNKTKIGAAIILLILLSITSVSAYAQSAGSLSLGSGYSCLNSVIYDKKNKAVKFSNAKKSINIQISKLKGKKGERKQRTPKNSSVNFTRKIEELSYF